jgi:hypothetical protein
MDRDEALCLLRGGHEVSDAGAPSLTRQFVPDGVNSIRLAGRPPGMPGITRRPGPKTARPYL